jgi:hypothetical protein
MMGENDKANKLEKEMLYIYTLQRSASKIQISSQQLENSFMFHIRY